MSHSLGELSLLQQEFNITKVCKNGLEVQKSLNVEYTSGFLCQVEQTGLAQLSLVDMHISSKQ